MAKQRFFVAVLVLQSRVGDWDDNPIVDHQVRIVRAANATSAHARALRLGAAENATYKNQDGQTVTWEFLGLSELDHLEEEQLDDGGEVLSWRTQGPGREFVREKGQLAVFAPKSNKTAGELLDE
jgi:uncharacterized protein DUF4288